MRSEIQTTSTDTFLLDPNKSLSNTQGEADTYVPYNKPQGMFATVIKHRNGKSVNRGIFTCAT